jgi:F0F1-type ATP synthase assembly protein I
MSIEDITPETTTPAKAAEPDETVSPQADSVPPPRPFESQFDPQLEPLLESGLPKVIIDDVQPVAPIFDEPETDLSKEPEVAQVVPYTPESPDVAVRNSGLAYSAATVLAASIIFMLVIGWVFDSFFGSAPYGLVGGVLIGAAIGFYQFFRITSEIFSKD